MACDRQEGMSPAGFAFMVCTIPSPTADCVDVGGGEQLKERQTHWQTGSAEKDRGRAASPTQTCSSPFPARDRIRLGKGRVSRGRGKRAGGASCWAWGLLFGVCHPFKCSRPAVNHARNMGVTEYHARYHISDCLRDDRHVAPCRSRTIPQP